MQGEMLRGMSESESDQVLDISCVGKNDMSHTGHMILYIHTYPHLPFPIATAVSIANEIYRCSRSPCARPFAQLALANPRKN